MKTAVTPLNPSAARRARATVKNRFGGACVRVVNKVLM
jgi:hypothetical protein